MTWREKNRSYARLNSRQKIIYQKSYSTAKDRVSNRCAWRTSLITQNNAAYKQRSTASRRHAPQDEALVHTPGTSEENLQPASAYDSCARERYDALPTQSRKQSIEQMHESTAANDNAQLTQYTNAPVNNERQIEQTDQYNSAYFLCEKKFIVVTDHQALVHFSKTRKPDLRFNRLKAELRGYEFDIVYRRGLAMFYTNNLPVPRAEDRYRVIKEYHESSSGGHRGINGTLKKLAGDFYWRNMRPDVHSFVKRSRNDGGNDNRRGGGDDRSHSQSNNNQSSDQKKESSRNDHAQSSGPHENLQPKKLVECSEQSSGAEQKGAEIKYKDARINLALSRRQPPLIDGYSGTPSFSKLHKLHRPTKWVSPNSHGRGFQHTRQDLLDPMGYINIKRMGMGLKCAPGIFSRAMSLALAGLQGTELEIYLDDVMVHGETLEEHNGRFKRMIDRFAKANMSIEPSKCQMLKKEAKVLGHIVGNGEIKPDPTKIEAMRDYPAPTNAKKVKKIFRSHRVL
ncbi:unnamed protein product [Trichogramma brassicae]|uniref:RNA-directed DNA polymerase n=1 Tax=Trichogramma brassicae TaxID=86971 RepID=A0A6H5IYE4_9HYME|nr:unnamed protein product [Trichogramma brassicae]